MAVVPRTDVFFACKMSLQESRKLIAQALALYARKSIVIVMARYGIRSRGTRGSQASSVTVPAMVLASFALLSAVFWYTSKEEDVHAAVGYPLNLLVVGDWGRDGFFNQSLVADQMGRVGEALNIDFVISTGDNFYETGLKGVDDRQFASSFTNVYTAPSLQKTWYTVLGNHDYMGNARAQLDSALTRRDSRWFCRRQFELKRSLCDFQGACDRSVDFFFIDTSPLIDDYWMPRLKQSFDWRGLSPRDQQCKYQLQNLDQSLRQSAATWKVVIGHHTIRSFCYHGDSMELVYKLVPILEANNVDIYLNGHDHCLEHIKRADSKVHYVTSGAGSRAWQGVSAAAEDGGLRFLHEGQGFIAMSFSAYALHIDFYDVFGSTLYSLHLLKASS